MKGKVIFDAKGKSCQIEREDGKGKLPIALREVTRNLNPMNAKDHNGMEVEFDFEGGQAKRIRRVGEAWQTPNTAQPVARPHGGNQKQGALQSSSRPHNNPPVQSHQNPDRRTASSTSQSNTMRLDIPRDFHNPYNFIPAPPRKQTGTDLDDKLPAGHDHFDEEKWSGRIKVKLTTATPLLIPDAASARPNEKEEQHKHFPTRLGKDSKPYLPPTSIKGMLRAVYEAVTNSRMAVFEGHEDPLAFRMKTDSGLKMVPARILEKEDGKWVEFYTGSSTVDSDGAPKRIDPRNQNSPREPMYAAWLPYYRNNRVYYDGTTDQPQHKDAVEMWIEKFQHHRWDRNRRAHVKDFQYWQVRKIVRKGEVLGAAPTGSRDRGNCTCFGGDPKDCGLKSKSYHKPLSTPEPASGFVCVTNRNINNKHDERVFFNFKSAHLKHVKLSKQHERDWELLIKDYAEIHKDEIQQGEKHPPALNDDCRWSRHIENAAAEVSLSNETLCYARIRLHGMSTELLDLYPVMIGRELHKVSPQDLHQGTHLLPAANESALSPADRVFGWVNQKGKGAYRGNVRISPVTCSDNPLTEFGNDGLPVAILGQPKPQQVRFYVAACANGKAQRDQIPAEEATYASDKGLRGRKVYPHHAELPTDYWTNEVWDGAATDRTQEHKSGFYREYLRPNEAEYEEVQQGNRTVKQAKLNSSKTAFVTQSGDGVRDKQNRSLLNWVKERTEFKFDIDVTNLSDVELGALLWLLELPEDHFHRLGGGKPLGFGSVQLKIEWEETDLRTGKSWRDYYGTLCEAESSVKMDEQSEEVCLKAFRDAVAKAYSDGNFEQASFIRAFRACAKGFNKPIHYPRARQQNWKQDAPVAPHPEGKAFQWFVANEKINKDPKKAGPKLALPDLADDAGLPYLDEP